MEMIIKLWISIFASIAFTLVMGRLFSFEEVHPYNLYTYNLLKKNKFSNRLLSSYEYAVRQLTKTRGKDLKNKVGGFFYRLILVYILLIMLVSLFSKPIYSLFFMLLLIFMTEVIVDYVLVKKHNQLLREQIRFNDILRQKYYEEKMVEDAIFETFQSEEIQDTAMQLQGEHIYDILTASDINQEVEKYNLEAANKYLKMLLNISYITAEYGDSKGESVFMKSLSFLSEEIRVELYKRERLNSALRSLNFISLMPLFFILPIQKWATNNFEPLRGFYQSGMGRAMEMAIFAIVLLVLLSLKKIQKTGIIEMEIGQKDRLRQNKALFTLIITSFIACLVLISFLRLYDRGQILKDHSLKSNLYKEEDGDGSLAGLKARERDFIKAIDRKISESDLYKEVERTVNKLSLESLIIEDNKNLYISKLYRKVNRYRRPILRVTDLIIALMVSGIAGLILLIDKRVMRGVEEEERLDEIAGFRSIVLMLIYHSRIGVEEMISWLGIFSKHYKTKFEKCLNDYTLGVEVAFENLKEGENEEFIRISESLQAAATDLSLLQAFDDLVNEKEYYLEKRKEVNRQLVEKKVILGRTIGFLPIYALISLYLIIPMIVTSVEALNEFYEAIG